VFLLALDDSKAGAQYEALGADPEGVIRRMLDFCGLPFDPHVSRTPQDRARRATPSASQVWQPLAQRQRTQNAYGARSAISKQVSEAVPNNKTITQGYVG